VETIGHQRCDNFGTLGVVVLPRAAWEGATPTALVFVRQRQGG